MERVEILINEKILGDLERNCNGNRSEFIRVAIEEKLSRKKSEDGEILKILRQMDRLDPNAIHEDVKNVLITVDTVFEEIQKQNQALKLILRRSTLASKFAFVNLEVNEHHEQLKQAESQVIATVNSEIQNFKL